MPIAIVPATMADMTYIGANLREEDQREIFCQLPDGTPGSSMAASVLAVVPESFTWVATIDGQPVTAFGFQPMTTPVWTAWAWGTRRLPRTMPAVTRFCWAQEDRLLELGVRRLEARSIAGHHQAHRWLEQLGCRRVCDLPDHGRHGELFHLYAWTIGDGRPSQRHQYRTTPHVLPASSEDPQATAASPAPEQVRG